MEKTLQKKLMTIYQRLHDYFGPQGWWPANSPLEVVVGAILTQNTAWKNVEKAIGVLKRENLLNPEGLFEIKEEKLAEKIVAAGYYRIKAKRLKNFINFLFTGYKGQIGRMFEEELESLREKLLKVKGIGEETADSILLYGGEKPIFVVDAYTRRILLRHNLIREKSNYQEVQNIFMNNLPKEEKLFNEYHALLVRLGKTWCKRKPSCFNCLLGEF